MYHGKDGNAEKIAVTGLSLSMQRGQCFGIRGPNGAGKTSLISMVSMNSFRCINRYCVKHVSHCNISFFLKLCNISLQGNMTNLVVVLLYTFLNQQTLCFSLCPKRF